MRLTVGPLPPAVYWRRRAIVLAAVLLVLFLVAQACVSASASPEPEAVGESTSTHTADPGARDRPTPTAEAASPAPTVPATNPGTGGATPASPAAPAGGLDPADACSDQELLITAQTGRASFPTGASVQFTIRVRNDADRSCWRDIGGDYRELYLRRGTGASKVWSSRDCAPPTGSDPRELEPGFETSYYIVWEGRSSASCAAGEPAGERVEAGDYQLVARLGTALSEPVDITVTG